jgi:hypothetical protein
MKTSNIKNISTKTEKENDFMKVVAKLRKNASSDNPSIEMITKELELVRTMRYAQNMKQ